MTSAALAIGGSLIAASPADLDTARRLLSEDRVDEALAVALDAAGDPDLAAAARALLLAADIEASRHRAGEAIALLRRATSRAGRAGNTGVLRESLEKTGALSLVNGRPGLAVDVLRRHLEIVEGQPGSRFAGRAHGLLGFALQKVGRYEAALAHYRRAAEYYNERGQPVGEISSLLNIGTVQGEWLGRFDDAARSFRRVLELADLHRDVPAELRGLAWLNLAEALADGGRAGEALACVESAEVIFERIDHRPYRARVASIASRILLLLDRPGEAEAAARAALAHAERSGDAGVRRLAHLRRGLALATLGREREALGQFEAASAALETLRRDIGTEEMQISFLRDKRETYEAWIAQLHRLHRDDPRGGWDAAALKASEASRCRSFLDHLPRAGAAAAPPEPVGLAGTRRAIGPDGVLLEYFFGRERVYLFVVSAETLSFLDLGPARELADGLAFALDDLRTGRDSEVASRLAARLVVDPRLDPLGGTMAASASWIVVPDGPLFRMPFGALVEAAGADAPPVSYVPSATVLARIDPGGRDQATTGPSVLAVAAGDPGIDDSTMAPLRLARREAQRAAAFFPGGGRRLLADGVREADLRRALGRAPDVVHFAAHALVDEEDPGRSGILLHAASAAAESEAQDGLLSSREVAQLAIDSRLVVLSGCTTSGIEVSSGEGVLGLGRAFLRAGARAVLVTLWDVSDAAAYEVTTRFYRQAALGLPLDAALDRAVAELDEPADARAFVLVGDGRTVLQGLTAPGAGGRSRAAAALILAGGLLLLAGALRRRARRRPTTDRSS